MTGGCLLLNESSAADFHAARSNLMTVSEQQNICLVLYGR